MGYQGDLDTVGLATIFQNLVANQQSGVLRVKDETSRRLIVFEAGAIRAVTSGEREQAALGEILVARGAVSEETLATALLTQRRTGVLLGETLVQMGACTEETIQAALRFQMEEQVHDLFMWRGARFRFEEGPVAEEDVPEELRSRRVLLNTSGLILEAMRRLDEWERIRRVLPSFDFIPAVVPGTEEAEAFRDLPPEEARVLARVDGANSVEEIVRLSALGRYVVTQALAAFLERGWIREATLEEMRARAGELVLKGQLEAAMRIERRILARDPADTATRRAYASALETRERPDEAAAEYARLADACAAKNEPGAAAEAAERAAILQPREREAQERAAAFATAAGRTAQAAAATLSLATILDEAGETREALARIDGALARDEANAELLQVRARLLNKLGETDAAVQAYWRLAELHRADGAFVAAGRACQQILRLEPAHAEAAALLREIESDAARRSQRRLVGRMLLPAAGALLLLLAAGAGIHLAMQGSFRRALERARAEAGPLGAEATPEPLVGLLERIQRLEAALDALETLPAPSPLAVRSASAERTALTEAVREALASARSERDRRLREQAEVLAAWRRWREHPGAEREAALAALRALAAGPAPTDPAREARALLAEWESREAGEHATLEKAAGVLADRGRPARERFAAFDRIRRDRHGFDRLLESRPDLTLPVHVEAASNTGAPLPARVRIGEAVADVSLPGAVEVPLDPAVPVALVLPGFAPEALQTPLPRGAETPERHAVTLAPVPAWEESLEGALAAPPVAVPGGGLVAATTAGTILALDAATGASRWPPEASPVRVPGAIFRLPAIHAANEGAAAFVDQSGIRAVVALESGTLLPPGTTPAPVAPDLAVEAAGLARFGGGGPPGPALLLVSRTGPPLLAAALAGPVHWPETPLAAERLRERVGDPAGAPWHAPEARTLLVCSRDGRLHRLLESGLPADATPLGTGPLEENGARFHEVGGAPHLLAMGADGGLHAFRLRAEGTPAAERLWEARPFAARGGAPAATPAIAGGRILLASLSGSLVVLDAADGSVHARLEERGGLTVSGPPVLVGDRILLPTAALNGREGGLLAYGIEGGRITGPLWRVPGGRGEPVTGLAAWRDAEGTLVVLFGAGRELRCLRMETPPWR